MFVIRFKTPIPRLMAKAGEADGGSGLDIEEDNDGDGADDGDGDGAGDDGDDGPVDRGDEVDPSPNADALAKVAGEGEDTAAGAEGDDTAAGGEGGAPAKKGSDHVPIGRFNEVNEQKKALEARVKELEAAQGGTPPAKKDEKETQPEPPPDIKKLERQYAEHLADGKFDEAVELREKINAILVEQAETNVEARQAQRTVQQSLQEVANQAVKDYPYLETEEGADVMAMIIGARDAGIRKGVAPAKALKDAVDKIAPKFAPEGEGTPGKELPGSGTGADTRTKEAVKRGAQASGQQPPLATGGAGNRATAGKVDVFDMTEEQFDSLTLAEKKRLRGDS